jgi:CheY-like chemotaxis protein
LGSDSRLLRPSAISVEAASSAFVSSSEGDCECRPPSALEESQGECVSWSLVGKQILIVEDEDLLAVDLAEFLEEQGATVVGPACTVKNGLTLAQTQVLDGAVIDVDLPDGLAYPVIDALVRRFVPLVLATGHSERSLAQPYRKLPRCGKPVDYSRLLGLLISALAARIQIQTQSLA